VIIAKAYRLLAALYHPDKRDTGDKEAFLKIVEAYRVLSDPVRRGTYDRSTYGTTHSAVDEKEIRDETRTSEPHAVQSVESEAELRQSLLQVLYATRRNRPDNPGLSLTALAELFSCSIDVMQFTLWYLRGKRFIDTVGDGNVAITVLGVDHVETTRGRRSDPDIMLAIEPHTTAIEMPSDGVSRG
jgi:DnaJ-like protein